MAEQFSLQRKKIDKQTNKAKTNRIDNQIKTALNSELMGNWLMLRFKSVSNPELIALILPLIPVFKLKIWMLIVELQNVKTTYMDAVFDFFFCLPVFVCQLD